MQKAVIYSRVSSERQVKEGHGLDSQETACRNYAKSKGYDVVKVFSEEGVSGGKLDRPAMTALLKFLGDHTNEKFVVIFDDIKRFARDTEIHFALKRAITKLGHRVESPSFQFGEGPHDKFIETIFAAAAELERAQNAIQVKNRMKARMEKGYWSLRSPPRGLEYKKLPTHGKLLVKQEPYATIYKEAIESYRDGLLSSVEDVRRFILKKYRQNNIPGKIYPSGVKRILEELLYTGWLRYKHWDIPLMKGKHEGFISLETYNSVQEKLHSKSIAPYRKDYHPDFPLRGFILCSVCHKPLTGSWHKGRNNKYAHYHCKTQSCPLHGKTVQKRVIEGNFEVLIKGLTPNPDVLNLAQEILADLWKERDKIENEDRKLVGRDIQEIEKKKKRLLERLTGTVSHTLVSVYEKEIESLEKTQHELKGKLVEKTYTNTNFGTASNLVFHYLEDPVRMWQSENYKDKRLLMEMFFTEKLDYDLRKGFGTVELACLPKLLCIKPEQTNQLVEMPGIGPGSGETPLQTFSER